MASSKYIRYKNRTSKGVVLRFCIMLTYKPKQNILWIPSFHSIIGTPYDIVPSRWLSSRKQHTHPTHNKHISSDMPAQLCILFWHEDATVSCHHSNLGSESNLIGGCSSMSCASEATEFGSRKCTSFWPKVCGNACSTISAHFGSMLVVESPKFTLTLVSWSYWLKFVTYYTVFRNIREECFQVNFVYL
jgi:hypothetical protein